MKPVVVDLPVLGCAEPCAPTVDLFDALERIETLAKQTQLNIAAGLATSGVCGLRKIELAAQDARRHATTTTSTSKETLAHAC